MRLTHRKTPLPTHTRAAEGIYGTTQARPGLRSTFTGTNTPLPARTEFNKKLIFSAGPTPPAVGFCGRFMY